MNILETATAISDHHALRGLPDGNAIAWFACMQPETLNALNAMNAERLGSIGRSNLRGANVSEVSLRHDSGIDFFVIPADDALAQKNPHYISSFFSNAVYVAPVDHREAIAAVVGENIPVYVEPTVQALERKSDPTGIYRRLEKIASIACIAAANFIELDGKRYCFFTIQGDADYDAEVFAKKELAVLDRTMLWRVDIVVGVIFDAIQGVETKLSCLAPSDSGAFFLLEFDSQNQEDYFASLIVDVPEHHHQVTHFVLNGEWQIQNFARWEWLSVVTKMVERRDTSLILIEQPDGNEQHPDLLPEDIVQFLGKEISFASDGLVVRFDDEKHVEKLLSDAISVTPLFKASANRYDLIERQGVTGLMETFIYNAKIGEPTPFYLIEGLSDISVEIMSRRLPIPVMPFELNKLQWADYLRPSDLENLQEYPEERKQRNRIKKSIEGDEYRYFR